MNELPKDLAGLQHLEPFVIARNDDIYVAHGNPMCFVQLGAGKRVGELEAKTDYNIYRKMPVAKQSDAHEREMAEAKAAGDKFVAAQLGALPTDAKARKGVPLYSGLIAYFPDALCAVAELSRIGNDQHNPGKPLHWDRSKSGDEADALMRHLLQKDEVDKDGVAHAVKVAWRGLALAQKYIEARRK